MNSVIDFGKAGRRCRGARLAPLCLSLALFLSAQTAAASDRQNSYESPEAAATAFIEALGTGDRLALGPLVGVDHLDDLVGSAETAADAERDMLAVHEAANKMYTLRRDDDKTVTMVIGEKAWPMPIPIVREDGSWRFDTAAGVDEVINRRIGRNELAALAICRAYIDAQLEYAGRDRDGDGVLEYARHLASTEGQKDGLYWPAPSGDEGGESPFGPLVAAAEADLSGRRAAVPLRGYYFRVIERQGDGVPGGRYDYVINGNMIAGFALIAVPAEYGNSGIMTFLVNHQGKVHEKDLGENTELLAAAIQEFALDETWAVAED